MMLFLSPAVTDVFSTCKATELNLHFSNTSQVKDANSCNDNECYTNSLFVVIMNRDALQDVS